MIKPVLYDLPLLLRQKMLKHKHFKLYKPFGVLSQLDSNDARQKRKKHFLTELFDFPEGIMPIGRLDEKSEGLLLMTTNGKLSYTINTAGVEKEYYAQLDGEISDSAIEQLGSGVIIGLDGGRYSTKPCKAERLTHTPELADPDSSLRLGRHRPTTWISITLSEGKFRQVRKMTAAVGFPTLRLVRVRVGNITLTGLAPGAVSQLQEDSFAQYLK